MSKYIQCPFQSVSILSLSLSLCFFCRQVSMQQESGVARDDDDDDVATERKRVLRGPGKRDLIRLENITKVYKTRKLGSHLAVDKLCLGVPQGEVGPWQGGRGRINPSNAEATFAQCTRTQKSLKTI